MAGCAPVELSHEKVSAPDLEPGKANVLWPVAWNGRPSVRCLVPTFGAGGSERVCLRLCNAWAEAGHAVEAIIYGRHEAEFLGALDRRVRVVSLEVRRAREAFRPLVRHLRRSGPAPLLVFGFTQAMLLAIASASRLVRHPLIYREGSLPKSNVPRSRWWLYRPVLRRFDAVVAQSDFAAAELADLGVRGMQCHVISNPLPDDAWENGARSRPGTTLRFLAVGRLSPEKGFSRLIDAFAQGRACFPDAVLTILGEGGQRAALERQIAAAGLDACVRLAGFAPDVRRWLAQADVVLASSVYEGQPNALMEALAAGCRVVTIDSGGGTREMMARCGVAEFVVPAERFEENFGETVAQALASPPSRWAEARDRLRAFAHVQVVQQAYFTACASARVP
ncbi:MAG: glycosyltransferase [Opitutae bacterium]|nr:glycosyltransferase [Opitutae bacterium]